MALDGLPEFVKRANRTEKRGHPDGIIHSSPLDALPSQASCARARGRMALKTGGAKSVVIMLIKSTTV